MTNDTPLAVYVHWPYCARICPYCDFNVYKNREIDAARWTAALVRDLEYWATQTPARKLTSLYFGGGTPSLAPTSVVAVVIETCERLWGFETNAEITLEANPTDAERARYQDFAAAGVNRLSLGVQSLRDDALKFLGRDHDAADARKAINLSQAIFDRLTIDLIYARPDQSLNDWREELSEALALSPRHLSLYQLTIEDGTAFERAVRRGAWRPTDGDLGADFFDLTQSLTTDAGLPAYEVSNHAAPGHMSRHNLIYWRQDDYIGVGPGAHGRLTIDGARLATETHLAPEAYLNAIEETGAGASSRDQLSADDILAERLSMGLRLTDGMPLYADDHFYTDDTRAERLSELIDEGKLTLNCGTLRATDDGRRILNAIVSYLLT